MMEPILTVTATETTEPVTVLAAAGEIDHDSRYVLSDAADEALQHGDHRLIIDLSGVSFCDSGGLGLFVDLHNRTTARGGWLRLACAQPPVIAVLRATNLDRLLPLHPTLEDALRAAQAAG